MYASFIAWFLSGIVASSLGNLKYIATDSDITGLFDEAQVQVDYSDFIPAKLEHGTINKSAMIVPFEKKNVIFKFAIDSLKPDAGDYDCIRLDFTGKGNFGNSFVLPIVNDGGDYYFEKTILIPWKGKILPVHVNGLYREKEFLEIKLGTAVKGFCQLGSKNYEVYIIDGGVPLCFGDKSRTKIVNDNVIWEEKGDTVAVKSGKEFLKTPYGSPLCINGQRYDIRLDEKRGMIIGESLNVPMATFQVNQDKWSWTCVSDTSPLTMHGSRDKMAIPAGRYTISKYSITAQAENPTRWVTIRSQGIRDKDGNLQWFDFKPDQINQIKLGAPLQPILKVSLDEENRICFNFDLLDAAGSHIDFIEVFPLIDRQSVPTNPLLTVRDDKGQIVLKTNLLYHLDAFHDFPATWRRWQPPQTLSGKFTAAVEYDLKLFGKLTAEASFELKPQSVTTKPAFVLPEENQNDPQYWLILAKKEFDTIPSKVNDPPMTDPDWSNCITAFSYTYARMGDIAEAVKWSDKTWMDQDYRIYNIANKETKLGAYEKAMIANPDLVMPIIRKTLGTDTPFYRLMQSDAPAALKLLDGKIPGKDYEENLLFAVAEYLAIQGHDDLARQVADRLNNKSQKESIEPTILMMHALQQNKDLGSTLKEAGYNIRDFYSEITAIAEVEIKSGQIDQALSLTPNIAEINRRVDVYLNIANAFLAHHELKKCESCLDQLCVLFDTSRNWQRYRKFNHAEELKAADIYLACGHKDISLKIIQRALPEIAQYRQDQAGTHDKALTEYLMIAEIELKANQPDEACKTAQLAFNEFGPDGKSQQIFLYESLYRIYTKAGKPNAAEAILNLAMEESGKSHIYENPIAPWLVNLLLHEGKEKQAFLVARTPEGQFWPGVVKILADYYLTANRNNDFHQLLNELTLSPERVEAYLGAAEVLYLQSQKESTVKKKN